MKLSDDIEAAVAEARAKVRVGYPWWLRPFLFPNIVAITFGRRIWLSASVDERHAARLLRHELTHVRQFARLGMFRFLWRYLTEYVRLRRSGLSSTAAYESISFEREALAAEQAETV